MNVSATAKVTVPTVSVVMAMYNAENYLREAIESILSQTYTHFEFIIVDDGSADSSVQIAQTYGDPRIRLLCQGHHGLVESLNFGIQACRGMYIARMDADDISTPERFGLQVAALDANDALGLVGSWYEVFDDSTRWVRELPVSDHDIKFQIPSGNPIGHGTAMYRRSVAITCGLYREQMFPTEDYDLWLRISERCAVANLPTVLYRWRLSETQITTTKLVQMRAGERFAMHLARERLINGHDQLGCSLPSAHGLSSVLLTTYYFGFRALYDGRWPIALSLWRAAFARAPMHAVRAWVAVTGYYLHLLSLRRLAHAALHSLRPCR